MNASSPKKRLRASFHLNEISKASKSARSSGRSVSMTMRPSQTMCGGMSYLLSTPPSPRYMATASLHAFLVSSRTLALKGDPSGSRAKSRSAKKARSPSSDSRSKRQVTARVHLCPHPAASTASSSSMYACPRR
jgi:hypothetical protein